MRLVVFGASGRTGRLLVERALAKGHTVNAFVRDPAKLALSAANLRVLCGDIGDAAQVADAIAGGDAVLSALGPSRNSPPDVLSAGAAHIIAGMNKHGVRRLVWQTGAGVVDPDDASSFTRALMVNLMHLLTPGVLRDSERAYALVRSSGLDWTVVRVPRLGDGPARGDFEVSRTPPGPRPVSRADVADFMLAHLTDTTYVHRAPMIGYK